MNKRSRRLWVLVAAIVLLLLGLRLALPSLVRDQLNARMDQMGDYHGHIENVDVRLWAGAYSLQDVTVTKQTADVPVPFFSGKNIGIALSWKALFDGALVAKVNFIEPELNFVDDKGDATQAGTGVDWRQQLEGLIPIRLDEINIQDGKVNFQNFSTDPKVDLTASQVEGRLINLTNVRDEQGQVVEYELSAQLFGSAPLELDGTADPFNVFQEFQYKLLIDTADLTDLNEFLEAYAWIDVESGTGTFLMELKAHDGQLEGYAKPLFKNIQVFSWKNDVETDGDGPFRSLWEALSGGIENLFRNQKEDQFATQIDIQGEIGEAETSTLQAIGGILKNAFIEAYRPSFENLEEREAEQAN